MNRSNPKFQIIYADPPWKFNNQNTGGNLKSGAANKYRTMSLKEICALPVKNITDDNTVLLMWWVASMPKEAIKVVEEWGFTLKTMTGFTWVKTTTSKTRDKTIQRLQKIVSKYIPEKFQEKINEVLESARYVRFFGMGFWTRQGSENCLIAVKGHPKRIDASIRSVIVAVNEAHSKKPHVFREEIIKLMGDLPRIELFARERQDGWAVWGDEVWNDVNLDDY